MMSEEIAILEFWELDGKLQWQRLQRFEGPLEDADDAHERRKTVRERVWEIGMADRYKAALQSGDEIALATVLRAAATEQSEYYARLLVALRKSAAHRQKATEELRFTWERRLG